MLVSTHEHTLLHTHASFLDQDYNPTNHIQPSATSDTEHSLSDCPAPHHARHATLLTDSSEDAQLSSQASAPETSLFACMGKPVCVWEQASDIKEPLSPLCVLAETSLSASIGKPVCV